MDDRYPIQCFTEVVPWRIELFGHLVIRRGEQTPVYLKPQRTSALLAYLAYFNTREHPREELVEVFWPEVDPESGRNRLKQTLSELRRQIEPNGVTEPELLNADRQTIRLQPGSFTSDVAEFELALNDAKTAVGEGRRSCLQRAIDLHRGLLLPGHYEDWVSVERERLEMEFAGVLRQLAAEWENNGDLERAIGFARRAVGKDPQNEEAQRDLVRLYGAAGRTSEGLRQYRNLEEILRDELGESPSLASREVAARLRQQAADAVHVSSVPVEPNNRSRVLPELEPGGGAVSLHSPFYIRRQADVAFEQSVKRRDSIVLVKGARQTGKTSLLARSLNLCREMNANIVHTDFQSVNSRQLTSPESLFRSLTASVAAQLGINVSMGEFWDANLGANQNMTAFMREVAIPACDRSLVWGMDEVDRLFGCSFHSEVFGLFRSWHNLRSLDPGGPWAKLTLAIAYATEVHLFITDLNQSPFNIGTQTWLGDFTPEELATLNELYGTPLKSETEVSTFHQLLGGQPYLSRCALDEMLTNGTNLASLEAQADADHGIFGGHLRHLYVTLLKSAELTEAVRDVIRGGSFPSEDDFYRLRSAGILVGSSSRDASLRCTLYQKYLKRRLL